jgi:hypothetical protein
MSAGRRLPFFEPSFFDGISPIGATRVATHAAVGYFRNERFRACSSDLFADGALDASHFAIAKKG